MKKLILIVLILLPVMSYAQRFRGGALVGMNVSQIDGDNWSGYNKAGLIAGAFISTEFRDQWGAKMEIRYAAKGSATPRNYAFSRKFRLQYIEIPLLATYEPIDKLELQLGVSYGYLYSAAQNDGSGYYVFTDIPNRNEFALCAGVNYELLYNVDVSARFSYSLMPIWADYSGATYGTGAWFNNVISFGFYYWIGGRGF